MPRQETPLDPADGPLPAFACELRALRAASGLSYRQLAMMAHYSHVIFVKAAGGKVLPSWKATKAFVTACGATDTTLWEKRWQTTRAAIGSKDGPSVTEPAKPDLTPPKIPRGMIAARSLERPDPGTGGLYPPDDRAIHSAADFAEALRRLKISAGNVSFRKMAMRVPLAVSTLADQCNPARRCFDWATVAMFLTACGVPPDELRRWEEIFWQVNQYRVTRRAPPQIDLSGAQTPAAFAQELKSLGCGSPGVTLLRT